MNNILQPLEHRILLLLPKLALEPSELDFNQLNSMVLDISEKQREWRTALMEQVFERAVAEKIAPLITQYQVNITQLLDTLTFRMEEKADLAPELHIAFDQVRSELEDALLFLSTYFPSYFNTEEKMPTSILRRAAEHARNKAPSVILSVTERVGESKVITIIEGQIGSFVDLAFLGRVSYRQLQYFENLLTGLERLGELSRETCVYSKLKELLIISNFNHIAFLNYFYDSLKKEMEMSENPLEALGKLYTHRKELTQMHQASKQALHPEQPSVRASLLTWLQEEIAELERITSHHEAKPAKAAGPEPDDDKIDTDFTVDELAIGWRLYLELRNASDKNVNAALRFIAKHFTTKRSNSISTQSLHSKYYELNPKSVQRVKDYLFELIKAANRLGKT